ncbi:MULTISPECIES: toxic anion resistance protein [unclassified Dermacoccus]|uniref:toxic anion resistance protein n=1 Tax=unclassified Dermacoccus TaxID=2643059 RepID=UPI000A9A8C4B|nr:MULTISPECIES: toxic anion resistance protein [unclassified Dermacoccus]MBZ4498975.1 toxic anion resistance protein [Dermacoccus sp. Tok2021]
MTNPGQQPYQDPNQQYGGPQAQPQQAPQAQQAPEPETMLAPPKAVDLVEPEKAAAMVPIDEQAKQVATTEATQTVARFEEIDPNDPQFRARLKEITNMGREESMKATQVSNSILQRPSLAGKDSSQTKVGNTLVELRQTITDLDPHRADLKGAKKVLKWLPGGDKVDRYFMKYQSSQTHLNSIIAALESGQDDLRKDNAGIQLEQTRLWDALLRLRELDEKMTQLDGAIEQRVAELQARGDTEKADAMKSQVLFTVRQRRQDLATEIAVATQGYMSLGLVLQNNDQLIQAVDRAKSTTVAALYTAVIVSEALARQKLVLDQINALRSTTSNMIEATSKQLRTQGAEINAKSTESLVEVEKLENAFTNVFATMDAIDSYRAAATDSMAQTISSLQTQIKRAEPYMERARKEQIESNESRNSGQLPGRS